MIGGTRTAVTDETGAYRFTLLPAGAYRVSFALTGFKTMNIDGNNVEPNKTTTVNGTMEVASTFEEVTVTSQTPTIDVEQATVNVNFDVHKLDDLPYSRSLTALNAMIPGVYFTGAQYDVGGSQFGTGSAVGGKTYGRSGNNVMAIDGLVWCQGYADYGSFEEVNFSTASKGADQANSGVTMEMIVKSGGNQFHGNFTTQYEKGSFQGVNIDQNLLNQGLAAGSNKFVHLRNLYGDFGGPIKKDKLWFYVAYMDGSLQQFVPGFIDFASGQPAVFVSKLQNPTAKLTYQLNSSMKLETSWPLNLKTQPYRNGNSRIPLQATQNQHSWATYGPNLKWTDIISSKMTATASINRGGYWWPDVAWSGAPANSIEASTGIPTLADANDVRRTDLTTGATLGPQLAIYRRPIRWTWTGDISRFQDILGHNNEIKVGYTGWWTKNYTTNFGYPNQQVYRYRSLTSEDYLNGSGVVTPQGMLQVFQHPDSVQISDYPNTTISAFGYKAMYFNDKITVNRHLTVTAGVRMDYYNSWLPAQGRKGLGPAAYIPNGAGSPLNGTSGVSAPDFATPFQYPEIPASQFPSYMRFVPRVSGAYSMYDGKLALKASYGRYTSYSSGISPSLSSSNNVNPNATTTCTFNGWDGTIPFLPAPGHYTNASCTGGGGSSAPGFNPSDPSTWQNKLSKGLDSDYLDEYTAGVDIGLSRDLSLRFNVVRKFDYTRVVTKDLAQPYSAYTDMLTYYYSVANNKVVAVNATTNAAQASAAAGPDAAPVYIWSVPKSYPTQGQINTMVVNRGKNEGVGQYTAYEMTFNKQMSKGWSALASYVVSMAHTNPNNPQNPNEAMYGYANPTLSSSGPTAYGPSVWDQAIKMNGSYQLPFGLMWSTSFSAQSGQWINLGVQAKNALGTNVTQIVKYQYQRLPWVNVWDHRFAKKFKIGDRQSIEGDFDLFNSMNINTITGVSTTGFASGSNVAAIGTSNFQQLNGGYVLKPTDIISPRIFQLSVKYKF